MIPLRDSIPSFRRPTIGYSIIILNTLIFFVELSMGPQLKEFVQIFGFVPRNFLLNLSHGNVAASVLPSPVFISAILP